MTATMYAPPIHLAPTRMVPKDRSELDRWAMRVARTPLDYAACASILREAETTGDESNQR